MINYIQLNKQNTSPMLKSPMRSPFMTPRTKMLYAPDTNVLFGGSYAPKMRRIDYDQDS